ncbi:MAG: DNA replication and repair protein RecF [FCB group bacterium]|nr:DNA replication and repair protein RecF [FCB group bacterium]
MISFRNHKHATLKFGEQVNVIWGPNGAGKTSVLEGIHVLSIGKSFKTSKNRDLLQSGATHFSVTGTFFSENREMTVQCNQLADGQRRFIINGKNLNRTRDLVGANPVVILSPEEQVITRGSPGDRRRYFNRLFSVLSREYLDVLSEYQRTLKQRNALLQKNRHLPAGELSAWDQSLVTQGFRLWNLRKHFLDLFRGELSRTVSEYTDETDLSMSLPGVPVQSEDEYKDSLAKTHDRDHLLGRTGFGPHRDCIEFKLNRHPLRDYGSQGEQKLALILIKIAEFSLIRNQTGKTPTFLLDDLFAKLDFQHSDRILSLLNSGVQTIITTTDLLDMENHGMDIHQNDMVTVKLD